MMDYHGFWLGFVILFGVLPPYVLLFLLFRSVSPPRFLALRAVKATLTGFLAEHVRAMPTVQLFHRQAWANQRSEELNREVWRKEVPGAGHRGDFADVDGDGLDELLIGFSLFDHDGSALWSHDPLARL